MTGKLEDKSQGQDSGSSSSESESSHGSRFDSQSVSSRCGGIRMNKDEKLAREAGIQLSIKVVTHYSFERFDVEYMHYFATGRYCDPAHG